MHIRNSEAYHNYLESNAHKELMQFKDDFKAARKNLGDGLAGAQNPLIVAGRDILVRKNYIKFFRKEFSLEVVQLLLQRLCVKKNPILICFLSKMK